MGNPQGVASWSSRLPVASLGLLVAAIMLAALAGCPPPAPSGTPPGAGQSGRIQQIGSTTVLPVAQKWQQAFNQKFPEVEMAISGGGSGVGISALLAGTTDIANASRPIKASEVAQARAAGVDPVEQVIAYDAIAIVVNRTNPLDTIRLEDLSDIFVGKLRQWDQMGVPGLGEIQALGRISASGTYEAFKQLVVTLGGRDKPRDYAPQVLQQPSNEAILNLVAQTGGGVGYVGLGYVDERVKVISVVPLGEAEAIRPSAETVRDGTYPISRALYCYTDGEPMGMVKTYLDWAKGPEGQALVEELGYVALE